jgi:hypothetical protein
MVMVPGSRSIQREMMQALKMQLTKAKAMFDGRIAGDTGTLGRVTPLDTAMHLEPGTLLPAQVNTIVG